MNPARILRRAAVVAAASTMLTVGPVGGSLTPAHADVGCSCTADKMCVKVWVKVDGNATPVVDNCSTPPAGWQHLGYFTGEPGGATGVGFELRIYTPGPP